MAGTVSIEIAACTECPYARIEKEYVNRGGARTYLPTKGSTETKLSCICHFGSGDTGRSIDKPDSIPDWCPLRKTEELPKLEPVRHEDGSLHQTMLRIGGKPFRCSCKCNVFHQPDKTRLEVYECNACGAWYEGSNN